MNALEAWLGAGLILAAMGELAVARKWLVFTVTVRVVPPAKPKPESSASAGEDGTRPVPIGRAS